MWYLCLWSQARHFLKYDMYTWCTYCMSYPAGDHICGRCQWRGASVHSATIQPSRPEGDSWHRHLCDCGACHRPWHWWVQLFDVRSGCRLFTTSGFTQNRKSYLADCGFKFQILPRSHFCRSIVCRSPTLTLVGATPMWNINSCTVYLPCYITPHKKMAVPLTGIQISTSAQQCRLPLFTSHVV